MTSEANYHYCASSLASLHTNAHGPQALEVVKTQGTHIYLKDGRTLIDGIASWWTACHGYNHPHIQRSIVEQIQQMPHIMLGGLTHNPAESLALKLSELLAGTLNHVFFSDSGSVSVEIALKMALQVAQRRGHTNKSQFVSFLGGYHGDTFYAMSVCDPEEGMHKHFGKVLPKQHNSSCSENKQRLRQHRQVYKKPSRRYSWV